MSIPFSKGHGLGNDYLVFNSRDLPFPLSPAAVRRICDRHFGIGSDGILLLVPSAKAAFGLRIFNPDGSEAEKSGNGLRIFAHYLWTHGHTSSLPHSDGDVLVPSTPRQGQDGVLSFTVETKGGIVDCELHLEAGRVHAVTVEMGHASFKPADIPMRSAAAEAVGLPLSVGKERLTVTALSLGNPHCIVPVKHLDEATCRRLGSLLENHPAFPNRINVQFMHPLSKEAIEILIWERGAGYTLASGSSSCAAAAAAVRLGLCDPGPITVHMPGGELTVHVRPDWSLRLQGPVAEVYQGHLSDEFTATLTAHGTYG